MSRAFPRVVMLAMPALLMAAAPLALARGGRPFEGQTYITVVDTDRRPVLGLSAEDFAMRDGAVRQPVIEVEPATAPLEIVLVTEGFEAADRADVTSATAAIQRAFAAAGPSHRVTVDANAPLAPSPAPPPRRAFVERLIDACQTLRTATTDRRAIVAILRRRADDGAIAATDRQRLTDAMLVNKIALWTIEAGPAQTSALDKMFDSVADLGGSLRLPVDGTPALADAASRVASLLLSQYLVTYAWPDPMLSQVSISIRHDRGLVLAPIWRR